MKTIVLSEWGPLLLRQSKHDYCGRLFFILHLQIPTSQVQTTGAPQTVPLLDRADTTEMSYAKIRLEQT